MEVLLHHPDLHVVEPLPQGEGKTRKSGNLRAKKMQKICKSDWSGAKVCKSCRSRKMLQNEYLVAKFGVDTAENERRKE